MNFLEAHRTLRDFGGGPSLRFLLAASGTLDALQVFLGAAGAIRGRSVQARLLPFNTFGQFLLSPSKEGELEVVLLMPWDLAPEADWRSGVPTERPRIAEVLASAREFAGQLHRRHARVLYCDAPIPPVMADGLETRALSAELRSIAVSVGADILPSEYFSLSAYFSTGCPFGGGSVWPIADAAVATALAVPPSPAKILVTDLDHVMWHGVLAEEGLGGIQFGPEGVGFKHFIYQSALARFKHEGVLLAAVSRNDPQIVGEALGSGRLKLKESDFIAVLASYGAKSAQIAELATQLNLGLDAFVFVDDNPIELEEVRIKLPAVRVVPFPVKDDGVPELLRTLHTHLARREVTREDMERTELYRRRMEGIAISDVSGADLTDFLRGLQMHLVVHDRSTGERTRAVQLINKTNQFNLNGRRVTDEEVGALLGAGGRLLSASLEDRTGSHGEILAYLVDQSGTVVSFVMSCRVFQRRVEHAFLCTLVKLNAAPRRFRFAETERNEPFGTFRGDGAFAPDGEMLGFDAEAFARAHGESLTLFRID